MTKNNRPVGNHRRWIEMALLVALPLLVFLQVGWYEFLGYDDPINIYQNPRVTNFSLANLLFFWQGPSLGLYIPLTYNFWMVIAKLSQLLNLGNGPEVNPALFHLANLLLHLGATLLVYRILADLLANTRAATAGALLFALHPLQVEAVAWASGMKDLLSGFWALLTIWQYLAFCREEKQRRQLGHYLLAALGLGLAICAKPAAVMVPILAGLLGWLVLARPWRQVLKEISPLLIVVAPVVIITAQAQTATNQAFQPAFWQRFLVAGDAISFYVSKLLLPVQLGPDYGRTPEWLLGHAWSTLTGCLPVLLAAILLWQLPRKWLAPAGIFVVALLPVSGLHPFAFQEVSTVADRYLYLALLGPSLAVGLLWDRYQARKNFRVTAIALLAALAVTSAVQTSYWRNPTVFSSRALAVNPRSWNSYLRQGIAQYFDHHPEAAIIAFNQALALKPDFVDALYGLGVIYWERGQGQQALSYFNQALAVEPENIPTALGLGDIYRKSGRCDLAIKYYQIAVASELDRAEYHVSLGECYAQVGQKAEARANFQQALDMQPDYAEADAALASLNRK